MNRRNFLAAVGAVTAGTTAVGTGAFTSVSADRTVTVDVASDSAALLGLSAVDASPNSDYVTDGGSESELAIAIGPANGTSGLGAGVNDDAVTRIHNLFQITNQGTQSVEVSATKSGDYPDATTFAVNNNKSHPNLPFFGPNNATFAYLDPAKSNQTLPVGDTVYVSLEVDTTGIDPGPDEQILSGLTIAAEATDE